MPANHFPLCINERRRSLERRRIAKNNFQMEARGFEPRSETRSTTASTCVFHRLRSPAAGQWTAHFWTSLLKLRRLPEDAVADYPEFSIPLKPPQEGFSKGRCSNSEELRSQGQVVVGV